MSNNIGPQKSLQEIIRDEYKKCVADPVYFMRKYVKIQHPIRGTINFDLYPFQAKALEEFAKHDFTIVLKSRQMGISTLVAAYSLWMMIFHRDKNVLIISIKQEVSKEIVSKVRFANDHLPSWMKVECKEDNRLSLKLANGSQILATSSATSAGRSQALSLLILDEAAFIEKAEEIWASSQPTLSCLDKNTLVLTEKGLVRLEYFINGSTKLCFNPINIGIHDGDSIVNASSFYMSDLSDIYEVEFASGAKIIGTQNHPLMTKNGWKTIGDIIPETDEVLCKYSQNIFGEPIDYSQFVPDLRKDAIQHMFSNEEIAYLCGLWTAEGHVCKTTVGITNTDPEVTNWLKLKGFTVYDDRHYYLTSSWLEKLLKWIGCEGTAHTKRVPWRILGGSMNEQTAFLRGLFDGDGCSLKSKGVKLTSVSYELLSNVRCMLLNMGINSYIRAAEWKSTRSTVIKDKSKIFHGYELFIGGWDAHSFYATIGFTIERKRKGWTQLPLKSIKRAFPDKEAVKGLILETGLSIREFSRKYKCYYDRYLWYGGRGLSISSVEKLLDVCNGLNVSENYKKIKEQYNKDTTQYYDKVVSVIFLKKDFSYDIKVPTTERFLSNGYVSHNTGGKAILLSTPNGVGNFFHKMWAQAEEGTSKFVPITLPWNLHPERDINWRKEQDRVSENLKKTAQELDCDFLSSGTNVIDLALLDWYKQTVQKDPVQRRGIDDSYWIWQFPDYSQTYIVCADVARGDGEDYSAFHVLNAITMEQCAEYKGHIGTKEFGNLLVSVATEYNDALLIVEREGVGWATLQQIIDRQYKNLFYGSADLRYVDVEHQITNRYNAEEKKLVPGFATTLRTRPTIISHLSQYLGEKSITIYSKRTYAELDVFIWENHKAQAAKGYNDDLVMALAIGVWVRDTALRLRQEGIDLTRSILNNVSATKSTVAPLYKSAPLKAKETWMVPVGRNEKEDLTQWL